MAIVKAFYRASAKGGATYSGNMISYITSRENTQGEAQERPAFSSEYDYISASEAIKEVAEMEGKYHYHVILNPGDEQTDVDLAEWTKETMSNLQDRHDEKVAGGNFKWIAVEHSDHSDHDHVHVIIVTDTKLDKDDLSAMRGYSSETFQQRKDVYQEAEQIQASNYLNIPSMGQEIGQAIESIAGQNVVIAGGGEDNVNYQQRPNEQKEEQKKAKQRKRDRGRDEPSF